MLRLRCSTGSRWFAALTASLLLLGATAQAALIDGLEAYWNFDDENFLDAIGIYDGEAQGTAPIEFVDGLPGFGKAIKLNGEDQHILITGGEPNDLAFAGGSMSVAGWFKVDAFDTAWQALIAKGEGTNWRVHRRGTTDRVTTSMGVGEAAEGGPLVNDGQWHHFVSIADATTAMSLYIDGELAEQSTGAPILSENGQRVRIAENPDARNREWEGELDDLAIWSRVLTMDEITALSGNPLSALLAGAARPSIRIRANAVGITVTMTDVGGAVVDDVPIAVTLNGDPITVTQAKVGNVTTISYSSLPDFLPAGAHTLGIQAQVNGEAFTEDIPFSIANYVQLDPAWIAAPAEYDDSSPGFKGFAHQMAVGRTPGDANSVWNAFRQRFGGYIDPATGNPYANLVDSAGGFGGVDANGNLEMPDDLVYFDPWININQDLVTAQAGNFQSPNFPDAPIPGIPGLPVPPATEGGTDNVVMETFAYLNFSQAPKLYQIAVNSDDGFHVAWGPAMRSALFTAPAGASVSSNAGMFSGAKGASDVVFDVAVPNGGAGVYLTRLVWWEGTGGASCEFFQVLDNGTKVLIGDTAGGSVAAYKASGAGNAGSLPADVVSAAPWPGQAGVNPQDVQVQVIIADGTTATVDVNSIVLRVNGTEPPKTTTRVGNTVRVTATVEGLLPGGVSVPVDIEYTAGGQAMTGSYTFTTINYPTLPPALGTEVGTGATPGMRWRTHQLDAGRGNTIALAEQQLAGDLGPSFHDPNGHVTPQGPDGYFLIDFVNFEQDGGAAGNFSANAAPPQDVADEGIPGIPGTAALPTDNIAAEALAYLELQPGFYTMVGNSDDGFQVSMGNADNPTYLVLGLFDGGRGSADTVFFFAVEEAGVYLFRLLWFEGGGGANVEWFTVNPDGSRALVNGTQTGSISAFRTRTVPEPEIPVGGDATFNPPTISGGQVNLSWEGAGTLQETTDLINWTNSASQANPQTVAPEGTIKAYRILVSP